MLLNGACSCDPTVDQEPKELRMCIQAHCKLRPLTTSLQQQHAKHDNRQTRQISNQVLSLRLAVRLTNTYVTLPFSSNTYTDALLTQTPRCCSCCRPRTHLNLSNRTGFCGKNLASSQVGIIGQGEGLRQITGQPKRCGAAGASVACTRSNHQSVLSFLRCAPNHGLHQT